VYFYEMVTKDELDQLVEFGKEIPDEDIRQRHLNIIRGIAENIGVTLQTDAENREENEEEIEQLEVEEKDERMEEELREQMEREEAEKRIKEEQRREQEERKRLEEDKARKQAELQRKKKQEDKEREERERQEQESRAKRTSFRRSTTVPAGKLNTGNTLDEVKARIPKQTTRGADLTDDSIASTYVDLRDDNNPTNWMLLRYDGQTNKLRVSKSGSGGFKELVASLVEEPLFAYFSYTFGDTSRTKFIFLNYVPEVLNGLKKAKISAHKPEVAAFLKYFHVEINALSRDDISIKNLEAKLRSAGGADYGSGRGGGTSGGENFGGIKANAANFYAVKDKQSKVEIVYQKGPLTTTPIDLSGRPMVASASEARKNTVDIK